MRSMWMPMPGTVFGPQMDLVAELLPDVQKIEMSFPESNLDNRFDPHVASEARYTFHNGEELTVPGYMLWKFLDMIPEQLGSEDHGYNDTNPFTSDYGERLMLRIRAAYQQSFTHSDRPWTKEIPTHVVMDLRAGGSFKRFDRPTLLKPSQEQLTTWVGECCHGADDAILTEIRQLIQEETSQDQYELGFKDVGQGMVGRCEVRKPWPDLGSMQWSDYLNALSVKTKEGAPIHYRQSGLVDRILLKHAETIALQIFEQARKSKNSWYPIIAAELRCSTQNPRAATMKMALDRSNSRWLTFDTLWTRWHHKLKGKTVGSILAGVV